MRFLLAKDQIPKAYGNILPPCPRGDQSVARAGANSGARAAWIAPARENNYLASSINTPTNTIREKRMAGRLDEFRSYRTRMNERIAQIDHLGIRRFFNLDGAAYKDGALNGKTKELLGLVASTVLRCNDCIDYHLTQCVDAGWSDEELYDAMNVALIVGGSIVIPHLRHAVETVDTLRKEKAGQP